MLSSFGAMHFESLMMKNSTLLLEKKANLQEEIEQLKRAVEVLKKKTVKKCHTTLMCRGSET
jgi:hypothetical protein